MGLPRKVMSLVDIHDKKLQMGSHHLMKFSYLVCDLIWQLTVCRCLSMGMFQSWETEDRFLIGLMSKTQPLVFKGFYSFICLPLSSNLTYPPPPQKKLACQWRIHHE